MVKIGNKKKKYNCVACKKKNEDRSEFHEYHFSESISKTKEKILKSKGYLIGDSFYLCNECKNATPKELLEIWHENIEKYSKEWLSKKEINQLFSFHEIPSRDLLLMRTCYYGGFRISEVLKSKWEDYRDEDYTYLLLRHQKTDKRNWEKQPIPRFIFGEIKRYCDDIKIRLQDNVFSSNRSQELSYPMAYKLVKKWVKLVGINKDITTHSFRRSRATHLLDDGLELIQVSRFLRHKSLETTRKYLKLSKKDLYTKVEKIDNMNIFNLIK